MLGAVVGDVIGSRFEWNNHKSKDFQLFTEDCHLTDDSLMTLAVAEALMKSKEDFSDLSEVVIHSMQKLGRKYPHAGFGSRFYQWLNEQNPQPYGSFGNGAAMRISPVALAASSLEEAIILSKEVTKVSHNHPEAIKGSEAVTAAVYLAKAGKSKEDILEYILDHYYQIDFSLDEIRESYGFDVSCQGSVPQALQAFYESTDFEDSIRNAISIGGDSDTIAAITGSISGVYYGIPDQLISQTETYLDSCLGHIMKQFDAYIATM